jgi:hypothetical protein
MSSWWSALNPFVEVKAEEATEDKKEEEPKDEGDDKGISSNSPFPIISKLITLQRRKKRKAKRKVATMKRRRRRRKKRNPKTPNLPWSNVFSPIKLIDHPRCRKTSMSH